MAGNGLEAVSENKVVQPPAEAKSARGSARTATAEPSRRRRSRKENVESSVAERFFLAESNGNGDTPALAREVTNESEAIIEAFKAGVNFFKISEFRSRAEVSSSGDPILKKEAVKNDNHSS
jgi:hypothetical protein